MTVGFQARVELDFAPLIARAEAAGEAAAVAGGEAIRQRACGAAPVRSGALVGSSRAEVDGLTARVSFNTVYAAWQHYVGTGPYLGSVFASGEAARLLGQVFAEALQL